MKLNNSGVTLIELIMVMVIMAILSLISMPIYNMGFRMVRKLEDSVLKAQESYAELKALQTAIQNVDVLDWKTVEENTIGEPLLCFQNGLVFVCEVDKPCIFENNVWKRGNKECSEGVLLRNQ